MDPRQAVKPDPRRGLPSVDRLIREASGAASELPNWAVRAAAREAVEATLAVCTTGASSVTAGADPQARLDANTRTHANPVSFVTIIRISLSSRPVDCLFLYFS